MIEEKSLKIGHSSKSEHINSFLEQIREVEVEPQILAWFF